MKRIVLFLTTHTVAVAIGFALGIYLLPILTAPSSPDQAKLEEMAQSATFTADFTRDLRGSDFLHWGEGTISITDTHIVHEGKLAPGPDYMLYLVPDFVDHEDTFNPVKAQSISLGSIKTFDGFILDIPADVDVTQYSTVVVWCEAFGEFITAAQYN